MSNYKTEMYIPVRQHHGDFDDFFKNRWLEQNTSLMDTEFDRKRTAWESKLDDMKRDFFHFSPLTDHGPHHYEAANTIQPVRSSNTSSHKLLHLVTSIGKSNSETPKKINKNPFSFLLLADDLKKTIVLLSYFTFSLRQ